MAVSLFQKISPADFKSLLKKIAEAEKALAELRTEVNRLAGIQTAVAHQRQLPEPQRHGILLDDD
jgi:hypothetical protein